MYTERSLYIVVKKTKAIDRNLLSFKTTVAPPSLSPPSLQVLPTARRDGTTAILPPGDAFYREVSHTGTLGLALSSCITPEQVAGPGANTLSTDARRRPVH